MRLAKGENFVILSKEHVKIRTAQSKKEFFEKGNLFLKVQMWSSGLHGCETCTIGNSDKN